MYWDTCLHCPPNKCNKKGGLSPFLISTPIQPKSKGLPLFPGGLNPWPWQRLSQLHSHTETKHLWGFRVPSPLLSPQSTSSNWLNSAGLAWGLSSAGGLVRHSRKGEKFRQREARPRHSQSKGRVSTGDPSTSRACYRVLARQALRKEVNLSHPQGTESTLK